MTGKPSKLQLSKVLRLTQDERGIGLSHVKEVIAAHGGCLIIISGQGAVISGNGSLEEIVKEWAVSMER